MKRLRICGLLAEAPRTVEDIGDGGAASFDGLHHLGRLATAGLRLPVPTAIIASTASTWRRIRLW
jgi:hypothetical protein